MQGTSGDDLFWGYRLLLDGHGVDVATAGVPDYDIAVLVDGPGI